MAQPKKFYVSVCAACAPRITLLPYAICVLGSRPAGGLLSLRLCQSIWLFYACNTLKIQFFQFFADGLHGWGHFIGYSFGISRNKVSTVFYGTAFPKRPQCPFPRRQAGLCKKAAGSRCLRKPKPLRRGTVGICPAMLPKRKLHERKPCAGKAQGNVCSLEKKGCVIENGWCFFPWNSKGITNKISQSQSPLAENLKKHIVSIYYWNKTAMYYDRAKRKGWQAWRRRGGRKGRARCFGEGELFSPLPQNSPRFAYGKALS